MYSSPFLGKLDCGKGSTAFASYFYNYSIMITTPQVTETPATTADELIRDFFNECSPLCTCKNLQSILYKALQSGCEVSLDANYQLEMVQTVNSVTELFLKLGYVTGKNIIKE